METDVSKSREQVLNMSVCTCILVRILCIYIYIAPFIQEFKRDLTYSIIWWQT